MNLKITNKILTIMLLSLPRDITREIESYLFYDHVSWKRKTEEMKIIQNRIALYKFINYNLMRIDVYSNKSAECFWSVGVLLLNEPQLQQTSCLICGDYKSYQEEYDTNATYPYHICKCNKTQIFDNLSDITNVITF